MRKLGRGVCAVVDLGARNVQYTGDSSELQVHGGVVEVDTQQQRNHSMLMRFGFALIAR